MMRTLILLGAFFFMSFSSNAQKFQDNIKLFIDCNGWCDLAYIKTEVNYVDFVPDRFTSNVYLLITSQRTGSGGEEIIFYFSGQQQFRGMEDTLTFNRSSVSTDDEYRSQLVQYLKLGLTRYVAKTNLAEKLSISAISDNGEVLNTTVRKKDPWRFWVINLRFNGNYSKDDYSKYYRYSFGVEAAKTTEKIKINNSVYYNRNVTEIKITDKYVYTNDGHGAATNIVKSVNQHWSFGGSAKYEYSTFSNYKSRMQLLPAVEYSFFPYKESVKKAITLYYEAGPSWNRYIDSSYYGNLKDHQIKHSLSLNFGFIQKWGNIYTNVKWESFLNNFTLEGKKIKGSNVRNFSFGGNMDIRIFKGLSFYSYFGYDITKGIFPNLRRADFTYDDLLTNTVQYPTTNRFYSYFGLTYRFGSIYNNVVNPRFNNNF